LAGVAILLMATPKRAHTHRLRKGLYVHRVARITVYKPRGRTNERTNVGLSLDVYPTNYTRVE